MISLPFWKVHSVCCIEKWIVRGKWKQKTYYEVTAIVLMWGDSSLEFIECTEGLYVGMMDVEESNVWGLEQVKGWCFHLPRKLREAKVKWKDELTAVSPKRGNVYCHIYCCYQFWIARIGNLQNLKHGLCRHIMAIMAVIKSPMQGSSASVFILKEFWNVLPLYR